MATSHDTRLLVSQIAIGYIDGESKADRSSDRYASELVANDHCANLQVSVKGKSIKGYF